MDKEMRFVINLIEATEKADAHWKQKMIERAKSLAEESDSKSLRHSFAMCIPENRQHGRHTKNDVERALDLEELIIAHLAVAKYKD